MKLNPIPLIAILLFCAITSTAQKDTSLLLRTSKIFPQKNIDAAFVDDFNRRAPRLEGKIFTIIQFDKIPSDIQRKDLTASGIELLEYIPNNAYTVSITQQIDLPVLQRTGARAVIELQPSQKMYQGMNEGRFPSWAVKQQGTVDVLVSFPKFLSSSFVIQQLASKNIDILSIHLTKYGIVGLRIATQRVNELASLPFIEYVQPLPPDDQPFNNAGRSGSKANILNAPIADGGRNLKGEGIVIGVGDNADPQNHVDFTGRLITRAAGPFNFHGTHVHGIVGGAGIRKEEFAGYAPKSTLISQLFSGVWINAPTYVQDHGMVITNNSYGTVVGDCNYNGLYDLYSRILDQQAIDMPELTNVFAAGNSGLMNCPPYPASFQTVMGSYQSAKNVITVGNTVDNGTVFVNSSRGPVQDGRIKPDIATTGSFIGSPAPNPPYDYYADNTGTSMASPAVAGGVGLLVQRYRQLNAGANPKVGYLKALICNGGRDQGNDGPDFTYGFGFMDLNRSLTMMENNLVFVSSIANSANNTHNITVPAGTAQVKVLLYWTDPAANVLASHTLVNDLDLEVDDPSSNTSFPRLLDTLPANVNITATTGVDHINNIEQVTINNPVAGSYTITVRGTAITQASPQEYFLVYDFLPVATNITFPRGGEALAPNTGEAINWDSWGGTASTFTVEYSTNNGASWNLVEGSVPATRRTSIWVPPVVATDQALVRITKDGTGITSTSAPFVIIPQPVVTPSATQCEGYFAIEWPAIAGVTDYEVMMLRGVEMQSVAVTTLTNYVFSGLSRDSIYWVAVRARINGKPGRRSIGIFRQPNSGDCTGSISDNDIKVNTVIAPASGRRFTSTALGAAQVLSVEVRNLDDVPIASYDMKYSVNGGAWVTETVNMPLAGGAVTTHNFAATIDMSAPGVYNIAIVAKNAVADPVVANDTIYVTIKQLDNQPVDLTTAFLDNFESAPVQTHITDQIGLTGRDRYDFSNNTIYGRLRTFVNTGMAYSGNRAITLDADRWYQTGNSNHLTGTFNLGTYTAAGNDIRFDFRYKNHGVFQHVDNSLWVRGSDTQPWILIYDLHANQNDFDEGYKLTPSFEISDILTANAQNYTTSFQVRVGQWGQIIVADAETGQGYTFDDIRVYEVFDDIQMYSIDTPVAASCALTASVPIQATFRNSANTNLNNVPVFYRINAGTIISDIVPLIPANNTTQFTFATPANMSAVGTYTLEVWVDYPTDSYSANDTMVRVIVNNPVITSFPHLQNFETDNGYWYTNGKKSSWEYGTPASNKIVSAASGSKAWKTRLIGNYNDNEFSYLYSPCYDISGLTNPTLSFSVALDLEDCGGALCDGAYVEYSTDGITWTRLGSVGTGTNWYNRNYPSNHMWSIENYTRWHVATQPLPTGIDRLRLRFVVVSDPYVTKEGIAIDDIHIYDNPMGIYDGVTMSSPVTQTINGGTSWVDFTSGGKLVASIQPSNQNMGSTDVQTYIHVSPPVRNYNGQYYHNRNLTIKPTNVNLPDSVTVRFYFLDTETDALIQATGCTSCTKPAHAYELGVTKYSDANDANENGTIGDNNTFGWSFINSSKVTKVPFDKGYYAEFKVKDFSEFWLNDGGFDNNHPLPVTLLNFNVRKTTNKNVIVEWKTASETNADRFEIEMAKGNIQYQSNNFVKIGEVVASGNSSTEQSYNFLDVEPNKSGVRYYRLKMIDRDGSFSYSSVKLVIYNNEFVWQVYPNPSDGNFSFVYQLEDKLMMNVKVFDANGRIVYQESQASTGFVQKINIDLGSPKFASGLYLVRAEGGEKNEVFRLIKK